jgi:hypothetical protein
MRFVFSVSLILFLMLFPNCNKDEEDDFSYCLDCPMETWIGLYEGSGTYFITNSGETIENVNVQMTVTNPYTQNLEINIKAENFLEDEFLTLKDNTQHYITINTGARSLTLNLYRNGDQFKLNGTLKRNRYNSNNQGWDVEKSLTFSVMKLNP